MFSPGEISDALGLDRHAFGSFLVQHQERLPVDERSQRYPLEAVLDLHRELSQRTVYRGKIPDQDAFEDRLFAAGLSGLKDRIEPDIFLLYEQLVQLAGEDPERTAVLDFFTRHSPHVPTSVAAAYTTVADANPTRFTYDGVFNSSDLARSLGTSPNNAYAYLKQHRTEFPRDAYGRFPVQIAVEALNALWHHTRAHPHFPFDEVKRGLALIGQFRQFHGYRDFVSKPGSEQLRAFTLEVLGEEAPSTVPPETISDLEALLASSREELTAPAAR